MKSYRYRFIVLAALGIVFSLNIFGQSNPRQQAVQALRKARACNGACKNLECFIKALNEYEQIRKKNPKLNLRPHNLETQIQKMKNDCRPRALQTVATNGKSGGSGGSGGRQSIDDLEEKNEEILVLITYSDAIDIENNLNDLELAEVVMMIDETKSELDKVAKESEEYKRIKVEELALRKAFDDLNLQIKTTEEKRKKSADDRARLEEERSTIRKSIGEQYKTKFGVEEEIQRQNNNN